MLKIGKIEVSPGFLLIVALFYYLDEQGIVSWGLLACALHEWGHYAAATLVGGEVVCLRLSAVGGEMELSSRSILSYKKELLTVIAGPAVNLTAAFLVAALSDQRNETAFLFSGLNFTVACFNLLPAFPLDGGKIVHILISMLHSQKAAEKITRVLTVMLAGAALMAGAILFWKTGKNLTLFLVGFWLLKMGMQR